MKTYQKYLLKLIMAGWFLEVTYCLLLIVCKYCLQYCCEIFNYPMDIITAMKTVRC